MLSSVSVFILLKMHLKDDGQTIIFFYPNWIIIYVFSEVRQLDHQTPSVYYPVNILGSNIALELLFV